MYQPGEFLNLFRTGNLLGERALSAGALPSGVPLYRSAPVSGAEKLESDTAFGVSAALERAEVAAAEDGRTPVNK